MRGSLVLSFVVALAGCGDDHTTKITCGSGTHGTLTVAKPVAVTAEAGQDLRGAAITATDATTLPTSEVSIGCAADIVPNGYEALGPAVSFGAEGTWSDRPFLLTLPYKNARFGNSGGGRRNVRIVAKRATGEAFFPAVSNRVLDDSDGYASKATFRAGELTTYQVIAPNDAGVPEMQQFGWNAIVGVSMGGNAAMTIGLRHPERFDAIADLGGEPGPSMVYSLSMVSDFLFGGFCTKDDEAAGRGLVGQLCPTKSTKKDQYEIESDYEHMVSQIGDGIGLTLSRSLYVRASRDLGRALGNPALYNPTNPYAPPGVPFTLFSTQPATRCATPLVLRDFHDREFNPDGSKPVITFCDGGSSAALGIAVFDPSLPQNEPVELLLAVDLNGNNKRDAGEPVITNSYEPFEDVGVDQLADKDEPGYDAINNRDPNGDDYHYLRNPRGTEGNRNYEPGEPYDDVGLDGVAGTCQAGQTPPAGTADCYDFGEGNGKWDLSPNVERWYQSDLARRLDALTPEQRRHISLWFDAGIRDFLGAAVSANAAIGGALARWELPFTVYDGFSVLTPGATELSYDFTEVPWKDLPKDGYLRYGNPDASASEIMNGDGRHVGTANQIIYRIETAFGWLNARMVDGDFDDSLDGGKVMNNLSFTSPTTGRVSPYAVFVPPGYNKPENADRHYPVVYVLHGYGMEPTDLVGLSAVIANHMISTAPIAERIQKFIMVYVDGRCRPEQDGVPVPVGGDGCESGTFYLDSPLGGTARMETNMIDLMNYIDATYRTRGSSAAQVMN